ncbi:MAG: hypothetical protein WC728_16760 [Elusimicrobiota bacterium]
MDQVGQGKDPEKPPPSGPTNAPVEKKGAGMPAPAVTPPPASLSKRISNAMLGKGDFRGHLNKLMTRPGKTADPKDLAKWSTDAFKYTPEQAKRELDPRNQMIWLLDHARKRPVLSSLILALVLLIMVGDAILIIKKLYSSDWLAVTASLDRPIAERFWNWENRGNTLELITEKAPVQDKARASAVSGQEKLPEQKWEKPALASGLAGIITPEELRQSNRSMVRLDTMGVQDMKDMGRTMVTQSDAIITGRTDGKVARGVFLGAAGEDLSNYASLNNPVKNDPEDAWIKGAMDKYDKVPADVQGNELVQAMFNEGLAKDLAEYQKGPWILRKMGDGEQAARHELDGMTMVNNLAVFQLLDTKRVTDEAMYCGGCNVESRIHGARATFYGEKTK